MDLSDILKNTDLFLEYYYSYCFISIILLYVLIVFSHFAIKKQFKYFYFWLCAMVITIPFLGMVLALSVLITLYFKIKNKHIEISYKSIEYPDYQHSPYDVGTQYGEGFGYKTAKFNCAPKAVRQNLLLKLNKMRSAEVNKLNSLVLTDERDDMRLYAQVLIEQQEKESSDKQMLIHKALNYEKDPVVSAKLKRQMAELIWDQIYRDLVTKINISATLNKIKQYALEANSVLDTDCEIPIILAKVALKENDLITAQEQLDIAKFRSAPQYKLMPYLAEVAYRTRDYEKLKTILVDHFLVYMQPYATFWGKHD